ncbi:MAG: PilW family protein [Candidatus Thiodiazotropha sp. (ex Lucinoma borealis)]|nr:PilW family protein [Candidatus Thiodiazotropha sp. (ex Lucinoma borealis)]MCU7871916.1 PilW family protein [Candidatus Thiodiazotropha sp. (ex Lucinoma borealis)]
MIYTARKQAGFSIISLMIASAIGLFLIGGAGKVYVNSKNAFTARSAIAAATEGARFSIQDMRRTIVMAGRGVTEQDDNPGVYALPDNGRRTFPTIDPVNGIVDVDSNGSSIIAIRYAEGPAPCGQGGTISTTKTARFLIDNNGNLVCQVLEDNYAQPLVSGLISMRALYGIDTDADDIANQYLTANLVDFNGFWPNVVSIRIALISSSGNAVELPTIYRPAANEQIDLMGMSITAPDNFHVFKTASTTISLRNMHTTIQRQ